MRPLSIYIHIPFCVHKCGYCDFNSYALDNLLAQGHAGNDWAKSYADAVIRELGSRIRILGLAGRPVKTVFFGGGTPSLFPTAETARILSFIRETFDIERDAEITAEANPGEADTARFKFLREAGINRLSIGVQSFNDDCLHRLERVHTGDDAQKAIHSARRAGFSNISIDLMFGTPFQALDQAISDIKTGIALRPEHFSAYELTIEPGTSFGALHSRGELHGLPDEDTALAMWETRDSLLSAAGFMRYEISNFTQPTFECRHNMNYWNRGEYLGVGAGAHSLIGRRRFWNIARPDYYVKNAHNPTAGEENVSNIKKALGESLMLGLRLREGVSLSYLAKECGGDPEEYFSGLFSALEDQGLTERKNKFIRLTQRGTLLANQVLVKFL